MSKRIPFNEPAYFSSSEELIIDTLRTGKLSGRGPNTVKAEKWLENENKDISEVFLTSSCTHALEMAAILLDLSDGDEVIVPSYTFVTSALAFHMHGARIRFCDIRQDTLNIDETLIEAAITEKTKAIVVVHYAGVACEMDEIMKIAKKYNLIIIEDNAHGIFGKYKGANLGSIGDLSVFSFHETKNISCGEGGALLVNNKDFLERAKVILEKGTNRSLFINGQVDKYSWIDEGSSYVLSDLLAGLLCSQLIESNEIQLKRQSLWSNYFDQLSSWSLANGVKLPFVPTYCEQSYHMFYMLMPNHETRNSFIHYLDQLNISSVFHYLPLDTSVMGVKIAVTDQSPNPVSEHISNCIVRLPLFFGLDSDCQSKVIKAVVDFRS